MANWPDSGPKVWTWCGRSTACGPLLRCWFEATSGPGPISMNLPHPVVINCETTELR